MKEQHASIEVDFENGVRWTGEYIRTLPPSNKIRQFIIYIGEIRIHFDLFCCFYDLLSKFHWNGVRIHFDVNVATKPKIIKYMTDFCSNVIYSDHMMHLVVIDKEIVWNCPSNLFENDSFVDGYLRYDSIQLASEALNCINEKDKMIKGLFAL